MMNIEIYDANGIQYRPAVRKPVFTKAWQGGEDLTFGFILDRSTDRDWPDVGYGYQVVLRNGLTALWAGRVRHIDQDVETIGITALGNWIYLDDYVYIGGGATPGTWGRVWSDTRFGRWKQSNNNMGPPFTTMFPEKAEGDNQNRLYLAPRKNEAFGNAPWIRGGWYYSSPYDDIKRIKFNYDVTVLANWQIRLVSYIAGWGGANVEWTQAATAAGAQDITLANARPNLIFYYENTAANAVFASDTGAVNFIITTLHLYGTTDTTPTVSNVAHDIIDQISAGTPIEADKSLVEVINLTLEPLFYEQGEMCYEALKDAAYFGDVNNQAIGWGVESGGARVFVRAPDRDSVRYVVPAHQAKKLSAKGQADKNYASAATGQYIDQEGEMQFTAKYYAHVTNTGIVANTTPTGDDLASVVYNVKKERVVPFGRVSAVLADAYIKRYVIEHGRPYVQSSFEVLGQVQDLHKGGAWIDPCELEMGYLVQIPHFRAVEAEGAAGTDLREWDTTFLLVGMQYDVEQHTARLIPEGAADDLSKIIEFARRFREQADEDELKRYAEAIGM
jgi:hypothetical protein